MLTPDTPGSPPGPFAVVAVNSAWSSLRCRSLVIPSPMVCAAAGVESSASSRLITDKAANLAGVTFNSATVASLTGISAASATKLALGSAVTIGSR